MADPTLIGDLTGRSSRQYAEVGRVTEGAAVGVPIHLTPADLTSARCHRCGEYPSVGADGRLRIEHDWAKHHPPAFGTPAATGPVRREPGEGSEWWQQ